MTQHMRKLDLEDKMDEDMDPRHRSSIDEDVVSDHSMTDDEDEDDMLGPGSRRSQRMSGVEETMFEMR